MTEFRFSKDHDLYIRCLSLLSPCNNTVQGFMIMILPSLSHDRASFFSFLLLHHIFCPIRGSCGFMAAFSIRTVEILEPHWEYDEKSSTLFCKSLLEILTAVGQHCLMEERHSISEQYGYCEGTDKTMVGTRRHNGGEYMTAGLQLPKPSELRGSDRGTQRIWEPRWRLFRAFFFPEKRA